MSENIYKPSHIHKSCKELCGDIVNLLLARNNNKLPTEYSVISVSNLCEYEDNVYVSGQFGKRSECSPESSQVSGKARISCYEMYVSIKLMHEGYGSSYHRKKLKFRILYCLEI